MIDIEIKPNINKKMDHVAISCMQPLNEDNYFEVVTKLSQLLKWLLQWDVGYCTIYFEHIGNKNTYDLRSWLGNTLVKELNHNEIGWSNQHNQTRPSNMTVNIIEKNQYKEDLNKALKGFVEAQDLTPYQSSLKNIARQNEKVKIFTNDDLAKNSQVVNYLKKHVKVFMPMSGDKANFDANSKSYFEHCNWDMLMFFGTKGVQLGGFPDIMREFCEIIHCGRIENCNIQTFYDAMKKYFNIQQRWGV